MEKKLKCWKKTEDTRKKVVFESKSGKAVILEDISGKPFRRGAWDVRGIREDGSKFADHGTIGKRKALKIANNLMKKHDRCRL